MKPAPNMGINHLNHQMNHNRTNSNIINSSSTNNNNNHNTNNNNNNNNNIINNDNKLLSATRSAIIEPAIGERFLIQCEHMFKPLEELPLPETFVKRKRSANQSMNN